MDTTRLCSICGKPIEAGAPQGLCPTCLLQGAFPSGTESGGQAPRFQPPSVEDLAPKFPQLELLGFIGQGGMGAVYKARQKELDRIVALKILPPDIGKDAAFTERFMREARALARLNHAGIVTIHDFGNADGLYFFLMEYVDGASLRQLLANGRIAAREALAIVPQICDALQYAHDNGIIHRDIKPENILLDRRGRVKVADFGLVKIVDSAGAGEEGKNENVGTGKTENPSVLTRSGKIVGTPNYMSPEQREHPGEVDNRADIYALGVVFYQMLTGELPGRKIEPPSRKVDVDVRLDEVVLRALEKKPERRYSQVSDVKREVETISSTMEKKSSVDAREEPQELLAAYWRWTLLSVMVLAGVLAVLFWRSFIPKEILFSNDRPLGLLHADWMKLPSGLTGTWADLNSIGFNAGSLNASPTTVLLWLLGPLGSCKFLAPLTLLLLGLCAWFLFRRMGVARPPAAVGALAVTLSSTFFSTACWGVTQNVLGMAMSYLAIGLIDCSRNSGKRFERWAFLALAGLALGVGILEAADTGTICSLIVLAYVAWNSFVESGAFLSRFSRGFKRLLLVAAFAVLMAPQPLFSFFQHPGPALEAGRDGNAKAMPWNWATQWSLPKAETAGLIVPGLFGFRMDTPNGGAYWGGVGRDPGLDAWMDSGRTGLPPGGLMRFIGGGNYLGVLVALVSLWAALRSFRRNENVFNLPERKLIWFWSGLTVICLLLAYGRFAPFYRLLYSMPILPTIRNPIRFLEPMVLAVSILFAYGLKGIWRGNLVTDEIASPSISSQLRRWWTNGDAFDRYWAIGCALIMGLIFLGWLAYANSEKALADYLGTVGFDQGLARNIAAFSVHEFGWFVLLFAVGTTLLVLVRSGILAGSRANWAAVLFGLFLVIDLGRANLPWMVYWNYPQKYASNDVLQFLQEKPYEHRVAGLPFRAPSGLELFDEVYRIEWMQHQFPFYNIQSLDILQMPRMPEDLRAYKEALAPKGGVTGWLMAREWQLTNTRYLLGPAGFLNTMNEQLDPIQHRFRIAQTFDIVPAAGVSTATRLEDLAAKFSEKGHYAIFEFMGALPRAKLFPRWMVNTNEQAVLEQLKDPVFDPEQTVIVNSVLAANIPSQSTNDTVGGSVEFESYSSKEIVLQAAAKTDSVLLLNDRFDPRWSVTVDGKPAALLRCNYIMRGVQIPAGNHVVKFRFELPFSLPFASLDVEPDTQAVSFVFHIPTGLPSCVTLMGYGVGAILMIIIAANGKLWKADRRR